MQPQDVPGPPLKRAIAACERSGKPGKVMVHIGGVETEALMSQILTSCARATS